MQIECFYNQIELILINYWLVWVKYDLYTPICKQCVVWDMWKDKLVFSFSTPKTFAQLSLWTCEPTTCHIWMVSSLPVVLSDLKSASVAQCDMRICLRNAQQIGPSWKTILSDFAYIASGDNLKVNTKCMWSKSNESYQSLSWRWLNRVYLFRLLWPLVVIWMYNMVDLGRLGKR